LQHPHADLSAYIDDSLDPAAKAAVEAHLVACAPCRAHVAQLRATTALLRALPDPVPARRLVPRLVAAPSWLAPLRTLMTLASGAAVFMFIASAMLASFGTSASPGAATTALERGAPPAAQQADQTAARGAVAPAPTATPAPGAAFSAAGPSARPQPSVSGSPEAAKRADAAPTAAPQATALDSNTAQEAARAAASERRPQLPSPWVWLGLAIACGAVALALNRRLNVSR